MKWLSVLLLAALGLAEFPGHVCAQTSDISMERERRTIEGNVYLGDTDMPVANLMVNLVNPEDLSMENAETGTNGEFAFRGLHPGSYTMSIDAQGYQKLSVSVDLTFTSSKGNVLRLNKKPGSDTASHGNTSPISAHMLSMPANAREAFDSGKQKLFQEKNPEGSLEEFQKAVTISPGFYEAYEQMSLAYLELGKADDAEKAASKSIELSGDKYAAADFDLGAMLMNRRRFEDGEKIVRHGLEIEPNAWIGHYELGRALFYEKRVDDALKSAEEARTLQPNAAIVYRLLALVHMSEHDDSALLRDLDSYIKLDPDSAMGLRAKQLRDKVASSTPANTGAPNP
jgi:Carboxypeptidase regulatory-like domain/Tetratricopeptide repeat